MGDYGKLIFPAEAVGDIPQPLLLPFGIVVLAAVQERDGIESKMVMDMILIQMCRDHNDSYDNQYDKNAEYANPVATANELKTAIANGEDVVLNENITISEALNVVSDVTIYGNGKTLKATGATRVINTNSNTEPVTLTLSGLNVDAAELERGITVGGNAADITIVMDNCACIADHYALNIASNEGNVNVIVRNTTLTGYCAFQTFTANTNVTFENCTLVGANKWSGNSDDFATIVVNTTASGSKLTFTNCRIEANEVGSANEYLLSVRATDVTATFEGCEFFVNDNGVAGNSITENMEFDYADTGLTIR